MMHLWLREIRGAVILKQLTIPLGTNRAYDKTAILGALSEGVKSLDLSMPVLLETHLKDWKAYHRAVFMPSDFLEPVGFDRLEAVLYSDSPKKKAYKTEKGL